MIDIKVLRTQRDIVEVALKNKGISWVNLDEVIELDGKRVKLGQEVDTLRARRNEIAASMKSGKPDQSLIDEGKSLKEKIALLEKDFEEVENNFYTLFKKIPNIPTDDTPIGHTEEENVVVKQWGTIKTFDFTPKNHYEIAQVKDWIDKERAANVSGARFAYLKWDLVKLQLALMTWVIDTLSDENILAWIIKDLNLNVSSKPFTPIFPPYMIKTAPYDAMDRLEPREERYKIEGQDLWLQGSAEHVLGSMYQNEIFSESQMPVRYIGYATSFRGEAGSAWKDMEWIIRMHQFDKLEMESFSTAETSHDEHLLFSGIQEYLMQKLEIPYQKLQKCTYDIGKPNAKGSDIEAWLPGQWKYRETHTADYMTDYQARRLQTRVRRENGSVELIHTNDATAFACGRAMVAIIENYQTAEWDVIIPQILRNYMGGREKI
jgi:seryl-tRNA synthetase